METTMDAAEAPAARRSGVGAGRLRTILVLVVAAVLVGVAAWYVDQPSASAGTTRAGEAPAGAPPRTGDKPPDFSATAIDGAAVSMAALKGQPTWLTFGASWCPDCRAEAPDLQATYAKYKDKGLAVLGVFEESEAAAKDYATRIGFTFPLVADPQSTIADQYRTYGYPIHFFIGRDGTIKQVRIGRLTPSDMEQLVQQLVSG
jgi:cytochrome c biogenesis protein CcmG/thiol:disulfide interchange protein DsbE